MNASATKLATDFDKSILELKAKIQAKRDEVQHLIYAFRPAAEVLSHILGDVDDVADEGRKLFEGRVMSVARFQSNNHAPSFDLFRGVDVPKILTYLFSEQIKAAAKTMCTDAAIWPQPGISQADCAARLAEAEAEVESKQAELAGIFKEIASLNRHLVGLSPEIHQG